MIRLDLDLIHHALTTASERGFASVEIGLGEDKFEAKLLPRKVSDRTKGQKGSDAEKEFKTITASAVGYFRHGKQPLQIGLEVQGGTVVAEIVSLGLSNDVTTKWSGKIVEVMVQADQPVEYGQVLAKLDIPT